MLGSPEAHWVNSIICYIVGGSESTWPLLRGDTHITSILRWGRGKGKNEMLSDVGVWGVSVCSRLPTFFFIKKNWIYTMTRHHANNVLLARNLPFDSDGRRWNNPLIIPLHCLLAKSNNRTSGQFEYDATLFFCLILFIRMHGAIVVPIFVYVFKLSK